MKVVVVVVLVFATQVKRGKCACAWINAVRGHWNIAHLLSHSVCFLRDSLALN